MRLFMLLLHFLKGESDYEQQPQRRFSSYYRSATIHGGCRGFPTPRHPFSFPMVFSRTERLVCRALTNGHSATEIAEDLEMAISSVGRHMRSAIHKAGLNNRY